MSELLLNHFSHTRYQNKTLLQAYRIAPESVTKHFTKSDYELVRRMHDIKTSDALNLIKSGGSRVKNWRSA